MKTYADKQFCKGFRWGLWAQVANLARINGGGTRHVTELTDACGGLENYKPGDADPDDQKDLVKFGLVKIKETKK